MKSSMWPWRQVAVGLLVTMLFEGGQWTTALAQEPATPSPLAQGQVPAGGQDSSPTTGNQNASPNSPAAYPDAPVAQSSVPAVAQSAPQPQSTTQPQQDDQQNEKPLGTAAAPYSQPSGVMGSRPAGAVIAPGRQRRIHAIVISVAIVAAAGIAIGTVSALSHGSPSRP